MITLADYWMGRDKTCSDEFKPYLIDNAKITVERANRFLAAFYATHLNAVERRVNSGWRPPSVNAQTRGASRTSLHITAEAIDLSDDDEELDRWAQSPAGLTALQGVGLWLESPASTPRWTHLQTKAPRSGNRIFIP